MDDKHAGERLGGVRIRSQMQGGFLYLLLMMAVAALGGAAAVLAVEWHTDIQRDRERQLLFVGNQIRNAIIAYYEEAPPQSSRFAFSLEDLLKDPRTPSTQRFLRKIYRDPITTRAEWGLVKGANGEIYGVHSLSDDEPIKHANFSLANRAFEGKMKYSEWVFIFSPGQYSARIRNQL